MAQHPHSPQSLYIDLSSAASYLDLNLREEAGARVWRGGRGLTWDTEAGQCGESRGGASWAEKEWGGKDSAQGLVVTGVDGSLEMGVLGEEQVWGKKEISVGLHECAGPGGCLWGKRHPSEIGWAPEAHGKACSVEVFLGLRGEQVSYVRVKRKKMGPQGTWECLFQR